MIICLVFLVIDKFLVDQYIKSKFIYKTRSLSYQRKTKTLDKRKLLIFMSTYQHLIRQHPIQTKSHILPCIWGWGFHLLYLLPMFLQSESL